MFDLRESVLLQDCARSGCEYERWNQVWNTRAQAFAEPRREKTPNPSFFECSGMEYAPCGRQAGASRREIPERQTMGGNWQRTLDF